MIEDLIQDAFYGLIYILDLFIEMLRLNIVILGISIRNLKMIGNLYYEKKIGVKNHNNWNEFSGIDYKYK